MQVISAALWLLLVCAAVCTVFGAVADDTSERIIAIPDLHGDLFATRKLLQVAGVMDAENQWIGGRATVVQLGDIADRGWFYHEIYDLFETLEKQAKEAGGEFVFLVGNHELMNLEGNYNYASKEVIAVFGGMKKYARAFSPSGEYGKYILQHPVALIRDGVLFVHGGLMPMYAAQGIKHINAVFRTGFNKHHSSASRGSNMEHPFNHEKSPLWSRQVIFEASQGNCSLLRESLRLLSQRERAAVHVMVVGHTIQLNGAVSLLCGGSLVAADVGTSRFLLDGGYGAFVEFAVSRTDAGPRRVPQPQYPFGKGVRLTGGLGRPPQSPKRIKRRRGESEKDRAAEGEKGKEEGVGVSGSAVVVVFWVFCTMLMCVSGIFLLLRVRHRPLFRRFLGMGRKKF